jgi:hypothetical protein
MLLPILIAAAARGSCGARWLRVAPIPQTKLNQSSNQQLAKQNQVAVDTQQSHFLPSTKPSGAVEELENIGNAQYLLTITVGGQKLKVVPDTGSFSLLLTSTRCNQKECPKRSFDRTSSSTYEELQREDFVHYGSGKVWTHAASDKMSIGGLESRRQTFWEITRVGDKMETLWENVKFDGIMGLGWREVAHSTLEKTVLETFEVNFFTFCFGTQNMEVGDMHETPSALYWGEEGAKTLGEQNYTDTEVIAVNHWAVKIHDVGVQGILEDSPFQIGCGKDQPCAAILDTGTSVISPPIRQLRYILNRIGPIESDCSNYEYLPTLHFWLGAGEKDGFHVELPPEVYIRRISFKSLKNRVKKFKKSLKNRKNKADGDPEEAESEEEKDELVHHCAHRFLFSLMESQHGPVWLIGAPFFQKYIARFDRSKKPATIGLAKHPGVCPGVEESELNAKKSGADSFFLHKKANATATSIPWNLEILKSLDIPGVGFAVGEGASPTNITL